MLFSLKTALSLPDNQEKIMIKCPFCNGDMLVDNKKFTCFSCFESGDIVDFLAKRDGVSHKKATWKALKEKPDIKAVKKIYRCNELAAKYFFENLLSEKNYFTRRGILYDTISSFGLGYASADNGLKEYLLNNSVDEETILASGLFVLDNEIKPFFRNRAMFPIFDEKGNVVGFGGRRLDDRNKKTPKYLNTTENLVFHKRDLLYGLNKVVETDTVYLVEGYMDVIALHQSGITKAVAALGTAIGEHHCTLLKEHGIKKIIISTDSDEAGINATVKSIPVLQKHFDVTVVQVVNAKDPDEYIKTFGKDAFLNLEQIPANTFAVQNSSDPIATAIKYLL